MKKLLFVFIGIMLYVNLSETDILSLNNQMVFSGKVLKIKNCMIVFKAQGTKYLVPASDIFSIQFGNVKDKVYVDYLKLQNEDSNKCLNGKLDAENYHGKETGHFVLGLLFGPFAIIGTAISNPTPVKGKHTLTMSQNKDQFNDPSYLSCYKKTVKGKPIGNIQTPFIKI